MGEAATDGGTSAGQTTTGASSTGQTTTGASGEVRARELLPPGWVQDPANPFRATYKGPGAASGPPLEYDPQLPGWHKVDE